MYWDIGRMIHHRQQLEGWGTGIIPRLAVDLKNELPEIKGFSERNIKRMLSFFREYPASKIMPQPVAQLNNTEILTENVPRTVAQLQETNRKPFMQQPVAQIPWGHNILLIEKIKDLPTRFWYMQQTIEQGWSRERSQPHAGYCQGKPGVRRQGGRLDCRLHRHCPGSEKRHGRLHRKGKRAVGL